MTLQLLRIAVVLSLAVNASRTTAADPPDASGLTAEQRKDLVASVAKSIADRGKAHAKKVDDINARLKRAKAGVIDRRYQGVTIPGGPKSREPIRFQTKAIKDRYIKGIETEMKKARDEGSRPVTDPAEYAPRLKEYRPGEVGVIPQDRVNVIRVIDRDAAVVMVYLTTDGYKVVRGTAVKDVKSTPLRVIVTGVDTSDWADGRGATLPTVFHVAGTQRFGGKTYTRLAAVRFTPAEVDAIHPE